jgi:hypothetical protein
MKKPTGRPGMTLKAPAIEDGKTKWYKQTTTNSQIGFTRHI